MWRGCLDPARKSAPFPLREGPKKNIADRLLPEIRLCFVGLGERMQFPSLLSNAFAKSVSRQNFPACPNRG
jgi:hypothetical protein